jgi:hypothetical protein
MAYHTAMLARSLRIVAAAAVMAAAPTMAGALQQPPAGPPGPEPTPNTKPRPGLLHIGPFFVTPKISLGSVGVDTNVFYSPTDRRTDLTATGGPGLEIVLPIRDSFRLVADGTVNYLYFLRTRSQRRFGGTALGKFEWKGGRTDFTVQETYTRSFSRPSYEVDRRVEHIQESTRAELRRKLFGRTSLLTSGERSNTRVPPGETFLGTDLGRTLSDNTWHAGVALEYGLTEKTAFVVEGSGDWHHFPSAPERDGRFDHGRAGLRTSSTTLVSGSVMVGMGWFHLKRRAAEELRYISAEADVTWHVSPRTRLGGSYFRGPRYSAFDGQGATPTVKTEVFGAKVEKELLGRRLDLILRGTIVRFLSDGPITVVFDGAGAQTGVRDDTVRTGLADLGYRFRPRLRIGVVASYTARSSTFADLGIRGLIVGGTLNFSP